MKVLTNDNPVAVMNWMLTDEKFSAKLTPEAYYILTAAKIAQQQATGQTGGNKGYWGPEKKPTEIIREQVKEQEARLMTRAEVAAKLMVCKRTIERWVENGALKEVRIGPSTPRYRVSDVDDMIQKCRIAPHQENAQ